MPHYKNLEELIKNIGIKTNNIFRDTIKKEPSYPSMESLINILDKLKISNISVKLQIEQLSKINFPAIAHIQTEQDSYFVLLKKIDNEYINFYDTNTGNQKQTIKSFVKVWTGTTILLSIDEHSGEPNYEENRKQENSRKWQNSISFIAFSVLFLGLFRSSTITWQVVLWLLTQTIGFILCVLLLIHQFGKPVGFVQKICHLGKKTDCQSIVKSSASKIFSWLSWAELGFMFFFGNLLSALFISVAGVIQLNLLLFPLVFIGSIVSIYYQWQIAKSWCVLCLGVIGSLYLGFIITSDGLNFDFKFQLTILLGYILSLALWFLVKPAIIAKQELVEMTTERNSWQQNSEIFIAYLKNKPQVLIEEWQNEISNEHSNTPLTMVMVSNPFCNPCGLAHKELKDWARFFEIRVLYRFTPNPFEPNHVSNLFIKHLYSIQEKDIQEKALSDWYEIKDYELWAKKYPIQMKEEATLYLDKLNTWCESMVIEYTPTFFINGYRLETPYEINHLKYHFHSLIEEFEIQT